MVPRLKSIFFIFCFSLLLSSTVFAQTKYTVHAKESALKASVRYSLIGRYEGTFNDFEGHVTYNSKKEKITSVLLNIKTDSIHSKYKKLDKVVRSSRLLDAENFPVMSFKSKRFAKKDGIDYVEGIFNLHGVKKKLVFAFDYQGPMVDETGKVYMQAKGKWKINRKDFDIVWHKFLDKGGLVVSDTVTINWKIKAYRGN